MQKSEFVLRRDQHRCAVPLAELRLLDLAGGIAGNVRENDLPGPLVTRQLQAEVIHFFFRAGEAVLDLDDRGCDLAEALVRQSDDRDVADWRESMQEIFDLDRRR